MSTYSIEFLANVEMVGDDPHPPALTTVVRPNLVVGDSYCLCYVTETAPADGIGLHSEGAFKAVAVCSDDVLDLFASGAPFELRAASRVFGKGTFRQIFSRTKNAPNAA
jgi:hypothetical protein